MKRNRLFFAYVLCIIMLFNTLCVNAVNFDLGGQIDGVVTSEKISNLKPYTEKVETMPFYYDNETLSPVFRMKFDEGKGTTVKESVSGKSYTISGDDFEWIENADIRYGAAMPNPIRQKSALRLNNSYINLGEVENLSGHSGELSIVLWLNTEVKGRNEDYVERPDNQYSDAKTAGTYQSAYKYDKNRLNVIFQSDSGKITFRDRFIGLNGIANSPEIGFNGGLRNSDFYNMYTVVIRKNENGEWVASGHGNVEAVPAAKYVLSGWDTATPFGGNLYIGTPSPEGLFGSMELGIADLMVFDKALTYQERIELYNGHKEPSYYGYNGIAVPTE